MRLGELFEADPYIRPLKPGQSVRITPKDSKDAVNRIRDYINSHQTDQTALINLKTQLDNKDIYDISDQNAKILQAQLDDMITKLDPKTHNFEQVATQVASIIKTRCSNLLPVLMQSKFLFRGVSKHESKQRLAYRAHSRTSRTPTDSSPQAQVKFDEALIALGAKALRSNSIFATTAKEHSTVFGIPYMIFPVNGSHYTFSENNKDLVLNAKKMLFVAEDNPELYKVIMQTRSFLADFLSRPELDDMRIPKYQLVTIASELSHNFQREPYITYIEDKINQVLGDQRFARPKFNELIKQLETLRSALENDRDIISNIKYNIDLDKFQQRYSIKIDTDIETALKYGSEVLINGEYIAVLHTLEPFLREALK